jgi:hypothetical protein
MTKHLIVAVVLANIVACGGKKAKTTPDESGDSSMPAAVDTDNTMVAPETMDEIERRFRRKGDAVSRCLSFAIDNKELPKGSKGKVTIGVTIARDGKADNIKIIKSSLDNQSLMDCVVARVKEIQFPEVPKAYDTTYTYAFEAS